MRVPGSFCKEIAAEKFIIVDEKNPIAAPNAKELTDLDVREVTAEIVASFYSLSCIPESPGNSGNGY